MYCCDSLDTLQGEKLKTVVISRPPMRLRKNKGLNLSHTLQPSKPHIPKPKMYDQLIRTRKSMVELLQYPLRESAVDRCITEVEFYESKNASMKNIHSSSTILKPYIPEKSLAASKGTEDTRKFTKKQLQLHKNEALERLTHEGCPIVEQLRSNRVEALTMTKELKQLQSSNLQRTREYSKDFRSIESNHLINTIRNLSGFKLTQSQVIVSQEDEKDSNVKLQESMIEEASAINNFILVRKRQDSMYFKEYLAVERHVGMVVSMKVMDVKDINLIYNDIILSQMLGSFAKTLELYQSIVDRNRQYFLLRQYYQCYLKQKTIQEEEICALVLEMIEIMEQLIGAGVMHLSFYDNLVVVGNNIKICNFQQSLSENLGSQLLTQHYQSALTEAIDRLINQNHGLKESRKINFNTRYIQLLIQKRTPLASLKKELTARP